MPREKGAKEPKEGEEAPPPVKAVYSVGRTTFVHPEWLKTFETTHAELIKGKVLVRRKDKEKKAAEAPKTGGQGGAGSGANGGAAGGQGSGSGPGSGQGG